MELDRNGLEVLSRAECFELLAQAPVGRIATTSGALPTVVPVNFVLDGESVVVRTTAGTKLDAAIRHAVVAFEADELDPLYHAGWSVVVVGVASQITDPAELDHARSLPLTSWAGAVAAADYMRITAEIVSGRRLNRAKAPILT